MEIIIGRDANTSQLKLTSPAGSKLFGLSGEVPMTVSRQHCKLTFNDTGCYKIENLKMTNETFVNGLSVQSKQVTDNDKVELGSDHYMLRWDYVKAMIPKTADIRPLRQVWADFDEHRTDQQIADRKFNTLRSATGLVTMIAIALSMFLGHGPVYIAIYAVAILLTLSFTIKAYRDATNVPLKMKKLQDDFKRDYVCPQCGHHYTMDYDELSKYDACPFCKTKFIK